MSDLKKLMNIWLLISAALLLSSLVSASYNYTYAGDHYGGQSFGYFNEDLDDDVAYSRAIANPYGTALVADLDNDTTNEIVMHDGATLRIYHNDAVNGELDIVDACSINSSDVYSNLLLHDIDDDDYIEMIIAGRAANNRIAINIIDYNGTDCIDNSFQMAVHVINSDAQIMIGCGDNECLLVHTRFDEGDSDEAIYEVAFNATDNGTWAMIEGTNPYTRTFCLPSIPIISYEDIDNDGTNEFIFSYIEADPGATDETIQILTRTIDASLVVTADDSVSISFNSHYPNIASSCSEDNISNLFSSPLVYNFDGAAANGDELVIAFMTDSSGAGSDAETFKMYSYESDLTFYDDYPEVSEADGQLVSNVFLADAFQDTGRVDFCSVGYDETDNMTDILCASMQTGALVETREYTFTPAYVIGADNMHTIAHAGQHKVEDVSCWGTDDLDEVITSYGVYQLTCDDGLLPLALGCATYGDCAAERIYEIDVANIDVSGAAVIPIDPDMTDRDDLIAVTDTNIWYIDDGYTDQPPEFEEICFNPCLTSTWEINTSFEIDITANDPESQNYRAKVLMYAGSPYQQESNWTSWYASGSTISVSDEVGVLQINQSIGSGTITIIVQDTYNNATLNTTEEYSFSVGSDGVVKGECSNCYEFEEEEVDEDLITDSEGDTYENNTITSGATNLFDTLGFGIGIRAIWLFLMLMGLLVIFGGGVMKFGHEKTSLVVLAIASVFFELLMIILGFYFSIFGWGTIIVLFMVAAAIVSLLILRQLISGGG